MTTEHNRRSTDLLALEITKRGFIIERQEKRIAELEIINKRYEDALVSIQEYWNRDTNQTAMHDALWHNIETAHGALCPAAPIATPKGG